MKNKFEVGSIVEFIPKITEEFGIEEGLGVIKKIANGYSGSFPYTVAIFSKNEEEDEEDELIFDMLPTMEKEFHLTNKSLYLELREWRRGFLENGCK